MTAPAPGGPADRKRQPAVEPVLFSEAEKLMAQWEAQHTVIAAGRRLGAVSVPQYVAHTRCSESPPTATPGGHHRDRTQRRPPPDPHVHLSDLWGWLAPTSGSGSGPADRRGDRGR
ncbi:hypothetical protein SAMN05661080_01404 [Modestobacter sp. DSM 44400]|uniref:hypothetical protein n=1 Tax=Modestobacter sp. DSM 44400 TaxID=1550230 RepID=UPI00089BBFB5|nr:hypothetical protein [Modestobacter sp. DSM 44400]SDX83905.1 hypothetical protein SAMN05661080_01404 [Modestobacter sp. DSM 44400]